MIREYIKLWLFIIMSAVSTIYCSNIYASDKFEFMGFYIGQDYWDVYDNIKKITHTTQVPRDIYFHINGFKPIFDRDLKLIRIVIPSMYIFNIKDGAPPRFEIDQADSMVKQILSDVDRSHVNVYNYKMNNTFPSKMYEYLNNDIKLSFNIVTRGDFSEFQDFIFEKELKNTGPTINGIQLGMPAITIDMSEEIKSSGVAINKPFYLMYGQSSSYCTTMQWTTQIMEYGWSGPQVKLAFGVEEIDDNFIQSFMNAYKINSKELSLDEFIKVNKIPNDYKLESPGAHIQNGDILKFYDCGDFYTVFMIGHEKYNYGYNNGIYVIYKNAMPFPPPSLPKLDKPTFN